MSSSSVSRREKARELLSSLSLLSPSLTAAQSSALISKTARALNSGGGGLRNEWIDVERQMNGLIQKHRILSGADELAQALEIEVDKISVLKEREQRNDRDAEIKMENIPAHLAFLLALSSRPDVNTHLAASNLLRQSHVAPQTDREIWEDIFGRQSSPEEEDEDEEEAWVEPDWGSEGSDFSSSDTSSSRGQLYDDQPSSTSRRLPSRPSSSSLHPPKAPEVLRDPPRPWSDPRFLLEDNTDYSGSYGWEEMLELPSVPRFIDVQANDQAGVTLPDRRRYLRETDAVREVLLALSGRPGVIFEFEDARCTLSSNINLLHLSPESTNSLFERFAFFATTLLHLRAFTQTVFDSSQPPPILDLSRWMSPTLKAFADGVQHTIWEFDSWLAEREQDVLRGMTSPSSSSRPPQVVTLLSFSRLLDPLIPSLSLLGNVVTTLPTPIHSQHPSLIAVQILDVLHRSINACRAVEDLQIASDVERIFDRAVEPMWKSVGKWLQEGMRMDGDATSGGELQHEFFIVRTTKEVAGGGNPDFWRKGYQLRRTESGKLLVPECFGSLGEGILAAGKAVGLLRGLGFQASFEEEDEEDLNEIRARRKRSSWQTFGDVVGIQDGFPASFLLAGAGPVLTTSLHLFDPPEPRPAPSLPSRQQLKLDTVFSTPPPHPPPFEPRADISLILSDHLSPLLRLLQFKLHRVLVEECGLMEHLDAIEGLFLMRKGECIGDWCEDVWSKMDTGRPWGDYYVLNSSFADAVDGEASGWIDPVLVRFWTKAGGRNAKSRSVKVLESLFVSYQVPSPLHFLFTPSTMQVRSSIFVFLLQLRRARNLMSRISLIKRDEWQGVKDGTETKAFYGLRKRLGWVISVLWDFIMTNVLHVQAAKFRERLQKTSSLDDMIPLHEHHIARIQDLCLLNDRTSPLFKTVLTILDLCVLFSDVFHAFTSDVSMADLSRRSILPPRRTTSRKNRSWRSRKRLQEEEDVSDLDEGEGEAGYGSEGGSGSDAGSSSWGVGGQTTTGSISFVDEPFLRRVERMSTELFSLVRFLQLGVDTLAKTSAPKPSQAGSSGEEDAEKLKRTVEMGDVRETWEVLAFTLEGYV